MKVVCGKRSIELSNIDIGAMLFLGSVMGGYNTVAEDIYEKWIIGEETVELDENSFAEILMYYAILNKNIEFKRR